jgi:hypothetical protein
LTRKNLWKNWPVATEHLHSISATTSFCHSLAFPKEGKLTTCFWKNLRVTLLPETTSNINSFISKNQEIPELINMAAMPRRYYGCSRRFFNDGIAGNNITLLKLLSIIDKGTNPLTVEIAVRLVSMAFGASGVPSTSFLTGIPEDLILAVQCFNQRI